jgi:hypothetical protein
MLGRAQERDEVRHVAGIAEVAERDLLRELRLALRSRVQALVDLLAVDATGGEAVHGDAVLAQIAGQALGPRVHGRLGRAGRVGARRLGRAGDVQDPAPAPRDHARHEHLRELADGGEGDRERLVPHRVVRVDGGRPGAARVVHQDVDVPEPRQRLVADANGRGPVGEVDRQGVRPHTAGALDLVLEGLQELGAPRDHQGRHALRREHSRDLPSDADAAPGHHGPAAAKLEVHQFLAKPLAVHGVQSRQPERRFFPRRRL